MQQQAEHLRQIIHVDKAKCVNCHACIAACPVKICNDGSGDYVSVNADTCIGCGRCLTTCSHGARYFTDDFAEFERDLAQQTKIVAVVAPSIVANFPADYLRVNGWLKSLGVAAVFDVSFGAELCAKSYAEYLRRHRPRLVISQPCPVVVSYIQMHQPNLLEYLAPVDSPMLHTLKMIRRYYPQFSGCRMAAISPCPAKRREFDQTGLGDYNITFSSIRAHLESTNGSLGMFPEVEFFNPQPDSAVLFPTPGGLLRAIEKWSPDVLCRSREIHGSERVCEYLAMLPDAIAKHLHSLPQIVDCLNCEHGCCGGPGGVVSHEAPDETRYRVEKRYRDLQSQRERIGVSTVSAQDDVLSRLWEQGLYERHYADISQRHRIRLPNEEQRQAILHLMHKHTERDLYNCCSCGYGSCQQMVIAIHNGLNRPENCHHYLARERELIQSQLSEYRSHLEETVEQRTTELRQEIAERCRAENALFDSERKLKHVVEGSPIPQFVIDRDHTVTYWNKALEQFSGLSCEQMVGTKDHWRAFYAQQRPCLADLLVDGDAATIYRLYEGWWKKAAFLDEAYEIHGFLPGLGDRGKWVQVTAALIRDTRGDIVGAVETLQDVTAQEESQQKLTRSQEEAEAANRSKSEFLANMSHEIRTPLTAILGYAELLLESVRHVEDIDALTTIKRNGEHLLSVINDILDLSKVEAGMLKLSHVKCSPVTIVEEVVSLMRVRADAKHLSLKAEYIYPVPETITVDATRLRQVLINLVGNAVKFTEVGGVRVRVSFQNIAGAESRLQLDVVDTGIGITEQQRRRLFQPFCQGDSSVNRKSGGTGLGLAISRRLAEAMGGQIEVDSMPGRGSTFRLTIDLGSLAGVPMRTGPADGAECNAEEPRIAASPRGLHCRVLLAEDGPDNQRLISAILKKAGANVTLAENGAAAIREILATQPAEEQPPAADRAAFDIVLMDMQMPIVDGYEATRQLRAAGYSGTIIALTAHAMIEDREKCLAAGCNDYMTKPIQRDKLLALVAAYCDNSGVPQRET